MSGLRTVLASLGCVGLLSVGYGMWSLIAPGEERKREMLKNLPEANPLKMEETKKMNALVMQALKEASETDINVAREWGHTKSQK